VRQTGLLVKIDNGGLGVRPELTGGGAQGIRGLQGMPTLDAAMTIVARANVHVELTMDRSAWNLDLVLRLDVCLVEGATTVGADLGQRRVESLVDLRGWRWRSMGFGAVVIAGLAARLLGLLPAFAFGERRCLPLAGPPLLFERLAQALNFAFELSVPTPQCLTSVADAFLHEGSIGKEGARSCARGKESPTKDRRRALNNYPILCPADAPTPASPVLAG